MNYSLMQWIGDDAVLQNYVAGLSTSTLLIIIIICIALLSKGADWMIDGVVDLAERTGLPKIVIGATVVSLGTSAPELIVAVLATLRGNADIAIGNVLGSNLANMGV